MSESQTEFHDRMRTAFRKDQAIMDDFRKSAQENCRHRYRNGDWVIGLQHNFSDGMPRGICLRCHLIIEPHRWASTGPDKVELVPAHHLYPVVLALDKQDHALALLRDVYDAAIDCLMWNQQLSLLGEIDPIYDVARCAIQQQCNRDIADVAIFTGVK